MPQSEHTNRPVPETHHQKGSPNEAARPRSGAEVTLDHAERESLEILLKEVILHLPLDGSSDEELYRSDTEGKEDQFKLNLYGYEMRALRTLLQKVR